jgi:hypothetical protein
VRRIASIINYCQNCPETALVKTILALALGEKAAETAIHHQKDGISFLAVDYPVQQWRKTKSEFS